MYRFILYLTLLALLASCGNSNESRSNNNGSRNGRGETGSAVTPRGQEAVNYARLNEPASGQKLPLGAELDVSFSIPDTTMLDSMKLFLGGQELQPEVPGGLPLESEESGGASGDGSGTKSISFSFVPEVTSTGRKALRLQLHFRGGRTENLSASLTYLSDLKPKSYGYRVLNEYPHDDQAYTQGLQYADGKLYEGTGERGASTLRLVELETGKVLKYRPLESKFFGEGITIFGERIYQLTYTSQVGFVYDKETFEPLQKIYYQNREGWGLTHNGEELIMSDGTHVIYFLDPGSFTINRQIEVYHDQGLADSLNELEYINGKIWANRYYTDEIVIIDPESGKVEARINLKGILEIADRRPGTDVLNGIAWDEKNGRIFVTGKRWPRLFEIELVPN